MKHLAGPTFRDSIELSKTAADFVALGGVHSNLGCLDTLMKMVLLLKTIGQGGG